MQEELRLHLGSLTPEITWIMSDFTFFDLWMQDYWLDKFLVLIELSFSTLSSTSKSCHACLTSVVKLV